MGFSCSSFTIHVLRCYTYISQTLYPSRGREIALWIASSSVKRAVQDRAQLHPFVFHRKVEIYQHVINLFPPVLTTGSTKVVNMLSCLCDNACKRSLAVCHQSRESCPVSRLLSVPIWPACIKQGRWYDSINHMGAGVQSADWNQSKIVDHSHTLLLQLRPFQSKIVYRTSTHGIDQ